MAAKPAEDPREVDVELTPLFVILWFASVIRVVLSGGDFGVETTLALAIALVTPLLIKDSVAWYARRLLRRVRRAAPPRSAPRR